MSGDLKSVMASEAWQSRVARAARQSRCARDMKPAPEPSPSWTVTAQAPRSDGHFAQVTRCNDLASQAPRTAHFVIASAAWQSRVARAARQSICASDMKPAPEPSPSWTATAQAPRSDGHFVQVTRCNDLASQAPRTAHFVIASEAWQSMFVSPQSFDLGARGLVCLGGVA
jgi:hypothetical protein